MSENDDVTLDDVEVLVWRILGAKDADTVDRLLKVVQAYADGQTARAVGRSGRPAQDFVSTGTAPVAGEPLGLDRLLDPGNTMLDVVRYAQEDLDRRIREKDAEFYRGVLHGKNSPGGGGAEGGGGPESVEKACFFEGGGSKSVEKSMLFPSGKGGSPSFSTGTPQDPAGEDPDFLGMLQEVVDEGRGKDAGKKTQICSNCRKRKSVDKFSKDRTKVSGYRSHCKACVVERYRARRM